VTGECAADSDNHHAQHQHLPHRKAMVPSGGTEIAGAGSSGPCVRCSPETAPERILPLCGCFRDATAQHGMVRMMHLIGGNHPSADPPEAPLSCAANRLSRA